MCFTSTFVLVDDDDDDDEIESFGLRFERLGRGNGNGECLGKCLVLTDLNFNVDE